MLNIQNISSKNITFNYESNPVFGTAHVPIMLSFDIHKSQKLPENIIIEDLKPLELSPFTSALHYGQSIFEGLKAYPQDDGKIGIFRPELHAIRFQKSAQMMSMASVSPEIFMECLTKYVEACRPYMPKEPGHSLYLRPILIATDPVIKVQSGKNYKFIIMSSIVGQYFKSENTGSSVLINKTFTRAYPGGTGEAKTSANYALSLRGLEYAQSLDFDQVLYVDSTNRSKIEELGGMNFFMVKNNELYTPKLDGQILHGVTRESIIEMAQEMGIKTNIQDIHLSELTSGSIKQVFASGTAASISTITEIGVQDNSDSTIERFKFPETDLSLRLRQTLINTHYGKTEFSSKWLHKV